MFWAEHAWILPAIPAIAFLVLFAFGRFLPRGGDFISVGAALTVFILFFFVLESHLDSIAAGLGGSRTRAPTGSTSTNSSCGWASRWTASRS